MKEEYKTKDNEYKILRSGIAGEYFHYRCLDCGFEDYVLAVACGADQEGGAEHLL